MSWGSYSTVRLIGGPADERKVRVHDNIMRIRIEPIVTHPSVIAGENADPIPRFRALPPIYIYVRREAGDTIAVYEGVDS